MISHIDGTIESKSENEVVLDPCMGSGQTAIAALQSGRHYVGYEIDQSYIDLATLRIQEHLHASPGAE